MERIQPHQPSVTYVIDATPQELEAIAEELKACKALPGQEIVRKLTNNVSIRYKPELSTAKFSNQNPDVPKIGAAFVDTSRQVNQ